MESETEVGDDGKNSHVLFLFLTPSLYDKDVFWLRVSKIESHVTNISHGNNAKRKRSKREGPWCLNLKFNFSGIENRKKRDDR